MIRDTPLAAAYGGGGIFGIAYVLGVAEALVEGGVPLATAPTLGTSAGSWAAAGLHLGVRWSDAIALLGDDVPRLPNPRSNRLRSVAAELFGERHAPAVRAAVCSLPRLRREVLSGAVYPVADLVAASSAVPGLLAPHRLDGRRYIDGGVRSMVSADLADRALELLVIAPIAGPMFGPAGRLAERVLRRETREWQTITGGRVWILRPNDAIADLAPRPDQLFSVDRAKRCYDLAREQASAILARWRVGPGLRSR